MTWHRWREVYYIILNYDGSIYKSERRANGFTYSYQHWPKIDSTPSGHFLIAWDSYTQDTGTLEWGTYYRIFDSNGNPTISDTRVHSGTHGH